MQIQLTWNGERRHCFRKGIFGAHLPGTKIVVIKNTASRISSLLLHHTKPCSIIALKIYTQTATAKILIHFEIIYTTNENKSIYLNLYLVYYVIQCRFQYSLRVRTHTQRRGAGRPAACDLIRGNKSTALFTRIKSQTAAALLRCMCVRILMVQTSFHSS
jgi:hypothetical protein